MDVLCQNGGIVKALNVNTYGNGTETLLLSHGYGEDQGAWRFMVPLLAYYFKVVVFDLVISPNVDPRLYDPSRYNASDFEGYVDDLVCLMDHLNLQKTVYLGHSMAAMVGCMAAIKRPQLFSHLILLNGSPRYINDEEYKGGFERAQVNAIFKQIDKNFSGWVPSFAAKAAGANNTRAIAIVKNSLGRMKPDIALSGAKTVFLSDLREKLPQVMVPTTIIQSKKDFIVPESVSFYMESKLGGCAKVKILKTQGHFPHLSAYNLLFNVLKEVLHIEE